MFLLVVSIFSMPDLLKSVQFSHLVVSNSLRPHGLQHASLPCSSPTSWNLLKLMFVKSVRQYKHLILSHSHLFPPSTFPSIAIFSNESVEHIRSKVLEFQLQHQFFQRIFGTDFLRIDRLNLLAIQENLKVFSNTIVKSISSSVLNILYSPTLTSIHDYWKNHGFD